MHTKFSNRPVPYRQNRSLFVLTSLFFGVFLFGMAACASSSSNSTVSEFVTVSGQVMKPDSTPVANATVFTMPATTSTSTHENGKFILNNLGAPGEYTIVAIDSLEQEGRSKVRVDWGLTQNADIILGVEQILELETDSEIDVPGNAGGQVIIEN